VAQVVITKAGFAHERSIKNMLIGYCQNSAAIISDEREWRDDCIFAVRFGRRKVSEEESAIQRVLRRFSLVQIVVKACRKLILGKVSRKGVAYTGHRIATRNAAFANEIE